MQNKSTIGYLSKQYRSILKKCFLISVGAYALLGAGNSCAQFTTTLGADSGYTLSTLAEGETAPFEIIRYTDAFAPVRLSVNINSMGGATEASYDYAFQWEQTSTGMILTSCSQPNCAFVASGTDTRLNYGATGDINQSFVNSSSGTSINAGALNIIAGAKIDNIIGDFVNNTSDDGGAVLNNSANTIENITGNFIGNNISSILDADSFGGGLNTGLNTHIENITGDFIANFINVRSGSGLGGGIYLHNNAKIDTLKGDFIGNYVRVAAGLAKAQGGAIHNALGTIGSLTGDFIENYTLGSTAQGGAIWNSGAITSILDTSFEGNGANVTTGDAHGGAIYNTGSTGKISSIAATFIGNKAEATNYAHGGAIYNVSGGFIDQISSTIFSNNSVNATTNSSAGGAIFNRDKISSIKADFTSNDSISTGGRAFGGAIYNTSISTVSGNSIDSIEGDFDGNYTEGGTESRGGAIWNSGTIKNITGTFKNNYSSTQTGQAQGGAIFNSGTINIKDSTFTGNYIEVGSTKTYQAIYNAGAINFYGTNNVYDIFAGTGRYNLASGTLSLLGANANFADDSILNVASGKITTIDNAIRGTNLGKLTLNGNVYYGIDVNLADGTGDILKNTNDAFNANGNNIVINDINIIADGYNNVTLSNSSEIMAAIRLDASPLISKLVSVSNSYNVIKYDNTTGILYFAADDLKGAVNSVETQRIYVLSENEIVTQSLGDMGGTELSVSGLNTSGENYEIIASPSGLGGVTTFVGQTLNISDVSNISGFTTLEDGGFINNLANLSIDNVVFEDNHANSATVEISTGGVINSNGGVLDITNSTFKSNTSTYAGGAIAVFGGSINNIIADFTENGVISSDRALGGAIYLSRSAEKIEGSFAKNYVTSSGDADVVGGAIAIMTGTIKNLIAEFSGNYVASTGGGYVGGGAIRNYSGAKIYVKDSEFVGNYSQSERTLSAGGAIFSHLNAYTSVTDSNFFDNYAKTTSGTANGGAVYLEQSADILDIFATNDDVYFSGNYTINGSLKDFNALHLENGNVNLASSNGNSIIFNDAITSKNISNKINIAGDVVFNDIISNVSILLNSGNIDINQYNTYNQAGYTDIGAHELEFSSNIFNNVNLTMAANTALDTINNKATDDLNFATLTLSGNAYISVDADLQKSEVDTINATSLLGSGSLIIDNINLISDSSAKSVELNITDTDNLAAKISIDGAQILKSTGVLGLYNIAGFNNTTGILTIGRLNLAETVQLNANDKIYTFFEDEIVEENLGTLDGNRLDIIGTGTNYIIDGNGFNGITVVAGKELNVTDVKKITGFISSDSNGNLGSFIINSGITNINNSTFSNNTTSYAGGVIRNESGTVNITNSIFTNNYGGLAGSSVLSNTGTATITKSTLSNNTKNTIGNVGTVNIFGSTFANNKNTLTAENYTGGAINNYNGGTLIINKDSNLTTLFEKNTGVLGGAISNTSASQSSINNATFDGNSANYAGAIYNTGRIASITNSLFKANIAKNIATNENGGGAIANTGSIGQIDADFSGNIAQGSSGGAIYNKAIIGNITGDFSSNKSTASSYARGSAIFNLSQSGITATIGDITGNFDANISSGSIGAVTGAIFNNGSIGDIVGDFTNNKAISSGSAYALGGAVYNSYGTIASITGSFSANSVSSSGNYARGGAILNFGTISLLDNSFTNNTVTGLTADGGAIYNTGTINISAKTKDITFSGNTANAVSNAIYNEGTINFITTGDNKIISYDGFSGNGTYNLAGNLYLLGENANFVTDSKLVIAANSMINTIDNKTRETNLGSVTISADVKWGFDIDLSSKASDIVTGTPSSGSNGVILSELNLLNSLDEVPTLIEVISDDTLALNSYLSEDVIMTTGVIPSQGVMVEYLADSGQLSFGLKSLNAAFSVDIDEKAYMLGSDESSRTAIADLGPLVGTSLSISGNGLNILGAGNGGANVASGQTLTFNDVSSIDGFNGNFVTNSGALNITAANNDTILGADADIYNNNATIKLKTFDSNTITLNNDILGASGDIIIEGNVIANSNIFNNDITLKSGTLNLGQTSSFDNIGLIAGGGALNLANGKTQSTTFDFISLNNSSLDISLDVDLENSVADKIIAENVANLNGNKINIKDLYIISDASQIETTVNIANSFVKGHINFDGVNIHDDGLLEDYNTGYLVGYSKNSGNITFSFATLQTAFSSGIETKAYAMVAADEDITSALILNGNSLSIDGNGHKINASDINVNDKALGIADVVLNSTLSGGGSISFDRDVTINSDISSFSGVANLNGGTLKLTENATFFNDNTLNIYNTPTINLQNGAMDVLNAQNWNMNSDLNVMIDVDLVGKKADSIKDYADEDNAINISGIFLTSEKQGQTTVSITDGTGGGNYTIASNLLKIVDPIYEYQYNIDSSKLQSDGLLTFVDTEYKEFNPAIVDSIVAKQSQYLSSISVYKEAFANFGTQTPLPYRNLSSGDNKDVDSLWFRPFGKNEDVNLDNGYTVDNEAYGALFGIDSPIKFYDNCWNGLYSLYAGYINSTQKYDDVKIEQDGFVVGYRALFERMNFFSGITANISASFADANNMFGKEDFAMYSTGIASKSGYNFGFDNNKYVLQPSLMMSYTFIHTPSYDNSSDVKISKQNLHAFQITPELKFIKNLESNRQVYVGANYNWNLIDASEVTANDIALPNVAVDPYAEFRFGTSKRFDNELSTFVEITTSTGGREGYGVEAGIKWQF